MNSSEPLSSLQAALDEQALSLPPEQVERLDQYCRLLWEWNSRLNLTRHTDYRKFVARDLIDSLAFAEFLSTGERVLDVGTGGGVPGVVLAVVRPDLKMELCESVGKKARAVADIVARLGMSVPVHAKRAEEVLQKRTYDTLVVRAVGRLRKLLAWFQPHWDSFGRLLILKGPSWVEERGEARHYGLMHELALRRLKTYKVPLTGAKSVLLQICPKDRLERFPPTSSGPGNHPASQRAGGP